MRVCREAVQTTSARVPGIVLSTVAGLAPTMHAAHHPSHAIPPTSPPTTTTPHAVSPTHSAAAARADAMAALNAKYNARKPWRFTGAAAAAEDALASPGGNVPPAQRFANITRDDK